MRFWPLGRLAVSRGGMPPRPPTRSGWRSNHGAYSPIRSRPAPAVECLPSQDGGCGAEGYFNCARRSGNGCGFRYCRGERRLRARLLLQWLSLPTNGEGSTTDRRGLYRSAGSTENTVTGDTRMATGMITAIRDAAGRTTQSRTASVSRTPAAELVASRRAPVSDGVSVRRKRCALFQYRFCSPSRLASHRASPRMLAAVVVAVTDQALLAIPQPHRRKARLIM
jgi:hypothetical protein